MKIHVDALPASNTLTWMRQLGDYVCTNVLNKILELSHLCQCFRLDIRIDDGGGSETSRGAAVWQMVAP